jgi:hypothetical protein
MQFTRTNKFVHATHSYSKHYATTEHRKQNVTPDAERLYSHFHVKRGDGQSNNTYYFLQL